jgi:hypothetical protein
VLLAAHDRRLVTTKKDTHGTQHSTAQSDAIQAKGSSGTKGSRDERCDTSKLVLTSRERETRSSARSAAASCCLSFSNRLSAAAAPVCRCCSRCDTDATFRECFVAALAAASRYAARAADARS